MTGELGFVHRFEPGAAGVRPLLVLHGTGGDENDLVPLARAIAPAAPLLSPRGKVRENGMARFFRRTAEGVFDESDVRARADELADFSAAACAHYGIAAPIALGFSNGANIAAALMLLRPEALAGGILLRATPPLGQPGNTRALAGKAVLIHSGADDPLAPPQNGARLKAELERAGARVTQHVLPAGHALSQADIRVAREWLAGLPGDSPES